MKMIGEIIKHEASTILGIIYPSNGWSIGRQYLTASVSLITLYRAINLGDHMQIKKITDGKTVGYIEIKRTWNGDYEITYIWTHPEHRGKGIASSLIRKAQEKYPILIGFFDPADGGLNYDQMVAWHKKLGFKKAKYYFWRGSKKTLPVMYWVRGSDQAVKKEGVMA